MHEYEFRLVVRSDRNFLELFQYQAVESVFFQKPFFRFRRNLLEVKRLVGAEAVYHDGLWFKWVHSIETPYEKWTRAIHEKFVDRSQNAQCPYTRQVRHHIQLDEHAQVYTFKQNEEFLLVFEYEYGTFSQEQTSFPYEGLLKKLSEYRHIYDRFRAYEYQWSEKMDETMTRKRVECIREPPETNVLVAHKWDGDFGIVYSYRDRVKEKWEGNRYIFRLGISLGDGIAFAAERMPKTVVLLDVYQVRGLPTTGWNRRAILSEFLPTVQLVDGYVSQRYEARLQDLKPACMKTDGLIYHDTALDIAYKWKPKHSVDVMYHDGYFLMNDTRFKCLEDPAQMRDGNVYEVSTENGRVIRRRGDRFTGNTAKQIAKILECTQWGGPELETASS